MPIQYRWALTRGQQPYLKLMNSETGAMASIMLFDRKDPPIYVVRNPHTSRGPKYFQKQIRKSFDDLGDAIRYARIVVSTKQ